MSIITHKRGDGEVEKDLEQALLHIHKNFNVEVSLTFLKDLISTLIHDKVHGYFKERYIDWHVRDLTELLDVITDLEEMKKVSETTDAVDAFDAKEPEPKKRRGRQKKIDTTFN